MLKTKSKINRKNKSEGVALLFAVLLTSTLLLIALGISNIAYRQAVFSIEAKDSDKAFFAADTGMECALYLQGQGSLPYTSGTSPVPLSCNGVSSALFTPVTGSDGLFDYKFVLDLPNGTCSQISVNYSLVTVGTTTGITQVAVQAIGYNNPHTSLDPTLCIDTPTTRTVTRALKATYLLGT